MTQQEAILTRHSVRQYLEKPIDAEIIKRINDKITICNKKGYWYISMV